MRNAILPLAGLVLAALSLPALAEGGGDREAAGGAFMSSYSQGSYANNSRTAAQAPNPGLNPRGVDVPVTGSVQRRTRRHR